MGWVRRLRRIQCKGIFGCSIGGIYPLLTQVVFDQSAHLLGHGDVVEIA